MKKTKFRPDLGSVFGCLLTSGSVLMISSWAQAEEVVELDSVRVTATATNKAAVDIAQPATVLAGEELERQRAVSLGETLSQQAGIANSSYGIAVGRPVIRGLGGGRVKILQNGIDTLDASAISPDHAVAAHTHGAKQIEVLRGPATLLYGTDAFGGVVNVVDDRIPHDDQQHEGGLLNSETEVSLRYDSVNGGRDLGLSNEGSSGDLHWHLDLSQYSSQDYEIPDIDEEHEEDGDGHDEEEHGDESRLENSDIRENRDIVAGFSYALESGHVGIALSRTESNFGIPGHGHEEEHDDDDDADADGDEHGHEEEGGARIDMEQTRVDIDGLFRKPFAAAEQLSVRVGLNDYQHKEIEGGETGTKFERNGYEGRAELTFTEVAGIRNVAGIQISQDTFSAEGEEAFVPETDSTATGVFWLGETTLGGFTFEGGLRVDQVTRSPETPEALDAECPLTADQYEDRDFTNTSVSAAVIRPLGSDWQVSGSLTSASRAPATQELFSCGAHAATSTYEIGNPDLDSEKALNADISLRKVQGDLTAALSVYQNNIQDFIYEQATGAEADGLPVFLYVQEDATFVGAELSLGYQLTDEFLLTALADQVSGKLDDVAGNDNVPRMPADRFGAGIEYQTASWNANLNWINVAKQDDAAANETDTDGYQLVNAGVSYQWLLPSSEYRVSLYGTNLLDEEIRYSTSFVKDLVPQPGRGFSLSVAASF